MASVWQQQKENEFPGWWGVCDGWVDCGVVGGFVLQSHFCVKPNSVSCYNYFVVYTITEKKIDIAWYYQIFLEIDRYCKILLDIFAMMLVLCETDKTNWLG